MKLYAKHGEAQTVIAKADFTGGLNTAAQVDGIGENQLAEVLNMEIDIATGKLQTVSGTKDILESENIFAALYDSINDLILLVKNDKQVYFADFEGNISSSLGRLTGNLYPKAAAWEDGLIIASGGKLQYFDGANLKTLDSSPFLILNGQNISVANQSPVADEVFVRAGRVCFASGNKIFYSAVGDENKWIDDSNAAKSAKWIEVGYKDGANIKGIVSLAGDVLVLKDNKKIYRLGGENPQWQLGEIGNNFECRSRRSFCKVGDNVFILGGEEVYLVENNLYGTMRAENLALQIKSEIEKLPINASVRFLSSLWQVWILGAEGNVLIFDLRLKSWWKRKFNSEILDVFEVGEEIFLVKANKICQLDKGSFTDDGENLEWKFISQRLVSHHDFLLKKSRISITPLNYEIDAGEIFCGRVKIPIKILESTARFYENEPLEESGVRGRILHEETNGTIEFISRNVCRGHYLDVGGSGEGGRFILQNIVLDIAEV